MSGSRLGSQGVDFTAGALEQRSKETGISDSA